MNSKEPIRIAYIIGKMWAGGVEAVVFNYYRAIDHSKFQFDFYYDKDSTVEPPQDLIEMGARFIMLPPYQKLPQYLKELRKALRVGNYKIVHSHLNTLSVFPLFAAWKEQVPVRIAHNHSVPGGNELKRNVAKQVLRRFSKFFSTDYFACSEKAGRWMFGDKAFDAGKVYVVKNAVDFGKYKMTEEEVREKRKEFGIDEKFVVGHVGRFTYAKNHQFLLDVFTEILKIKPEAMLLLVGDGELREEIMNGIKKRRIDERVILTGKVQDPENYYKLNDVIILPSVFEGLSMSTIESQVAKVPVVISRAIPEEAVISNGCLYMDINDSPVLWAKAAIEMAGKRVTLNSASREYNINNVVAGLENKYVCLLER